VSTTLTSRVEAAVAAIANGEFVVVLDHEDRENEGDLGLPVDDREYAVGAQILDDLGVQAVRLMTNNPAKMEGVAGSGFEITERVPLIVEPTTDNAAYLTAKRRKLGHLLPQVSRSEWWRRTLLPSPFFTLAD